MNSPNHKLAVAAAASAFILAGCPPLFASSHQDAPLAVLDPAANTTDVYAFVDQDDGKKSLLVALGVYPFEEPGIGPNKFNFDDNVLYEIHVALGADRVAGRATLSYQFEFKSRTQNPHTILDNFTGVIHTWTWSIPIPPRTSFRPTGSQTSIIARTAGLCWVLELFPRTTRAP
jgi:Domain of unknown function (DUF4331)